jgi:hypothetical protein
MVSFTTQQLRVRLERYWVEVVVEYIKVLTTEWSEFESRWDQEFSFLQIVQIGSGVHPNYSPMGTGGKVEGA